MSRFLLLFGNKLLCAFASLRETFLPKAQIINLSGLGIKLRKA